jgi:hypothetical protein
MMDVEFTVQDGTLYMLQCRSGKRTGWGAVTIAYDMVAEGLIRWVVSESLPSHTSCVLGLGTLH